MAGCFVSPSTCLRKVTASEISSSSEWSTRRNHECSNTFDELVVAERTVRVDVPRGQPVQALVTVQLKRLRWIAQRVDHGVGQPARRSMSLLLGNPLAQRQNRLGPAAANWRAVARCDLSTDSDKSEVPAAMGF